MIKKAAFLELREQAIALRRAGRSRREIKELLGITQRRDPERGAQGRAAAAMELGARTPRTRLRAKARDLRLQGLDYDQIAAELGVSKSSVSLWVRDMPRPDRA